MPEWLRQAIIDTWHSRTGLVLALVAAFQRLVPLVTKFDLSAGGGMKTVVSTAFLACALATSVNAQWLNHRDPNIPRTADGTPNLAAPPPRFNGKPDLSGVWEAERTSADEYSTALGPGFAQLQVDFNDVTKHVLNAFWGVKPGEEPFTSEGVAAFRQRQAQGVQGALSACLPAGLPVNLFVLWFKMIQAPGEIVVIPGTGDPPRQIYTDGRSLPRDPEPSWTGHSVGAWQGDTLVVETVGIHPRAALDAFGHPRSEQMRITERYHRRDFGHIDLEITLEDPKYYTRPFDIKTTLKLVADSDVLDYVCSENEKDGAHLKK